MVLVAYCCITNPRKLSGLKQCGSAVRDHLATYCLWFPGGIRGVGQAMFSSEGLTASLRILAEFIALKLWD